jgi:hypothetical protein
LGDYLHLAVFGNNKSSPHFWATQSHSQGYVLILAKNGLGYILGEFFTNSSGHPAPRTAISVPLCWMTFSKIFRKIVSAENAANAASHDDASGNGPFIFSSQKNRLHNFRPLPKPECR